MAIDRANVLKNAEKLLRQGRLDQAIAEYLRVVEDQPRDWNTANLLGDLYVRAGQLDRAQQQFIGVADTFAADGFLPRAAAVYKKVLKLNPANEYALRKAGDIAAGQGLMADARSHYTALLERRRQRKDEAGIAEASQLLQSLDPRPVEPAATFVAAAVVVAEPSEPALVAEPPVDEPVAPDESLPSTVTLTSVAEPEPLAIAEPGATLNTNAALLEEPQPSAADSPPSSDASDFASDQPTAVAEPAVLEQPMLEVDLSGALDALLAPTAAVDRGSPGSPSPVAALDDIFAAMRDEAADQSGEDEAQRLYQQALILRERGAIDEAVRAFKAASRSPRLRFAAALQLGRLYRDRGALDDAVAWFEHAAEVPAPRPADGYDVLWDLADVLERAGEPDRAMAVLLELKAEAGNYKDLDSRIGRLDKVRAGG